MKVIWKSYKGRDRRHNSDYGIFCNYPEQYIFIIGDAREEIESNHFIKYILEFIARQLHLQSPNEIKYILKSAKYSYVENEGFLRKLPNQMASLHILIVDKISLQAQSFNLGDCRFGYRDNDKWVWLTEPHIMLECEYRVTQSFRTKKPIGEICKREFHLEDEGVYCLGSDGYWRNDTNQHDDSSYLEVSELGIARVEIDCEEANFIDFKE